MVSKKTTCDLPQNQMNFKSSVRRLIRAQSDMSHYDIQHLVGQAVDLEIQRQNQREQGKI